MDEQEKPKFEISLGPADIHRAPEFVNRYANHVVLQAAIWDVKMLFGQLDQTVGKNAVVQDTAVTLPWTQVKIFSYLLQQQLIAHELQFGRIIVPQGIVAAPQDIPEEVKNQVPVLAEVETAVKSLYGAFLDANPEAKS
jgi:hypothetical protein